MRMLLTTFIFIFSSMASLQASPTLIARVSNRDGYRLPMTASLNDVSPAIDNQGNIAFNVLFADDELNHGAFYYNAVKQQGGLVYIAPRNLFLSDVTLYKEKIYFSLFADNYLEGAFVVNPITQESSEALSPDDFPGALYMGTLKQTDIGLIFKQSNSHSRTISLKKPEQEFARAIARERNGTSYLFTPDISQAGYSAFKKRLGERGQVGEEQEDQIILYKPSGEFEIVATDKDSSYQGFFNNVGVSSIGHVAFTAKVSDSKYCHFVSLLGKTNQVVCEGEHGIKEFERFSVRVNSKGDIAFRAIQQNGLRGVFKTVKRKVEKLVEENQIVPTDIAPARVLLRKGWPGFGGNLAFNDHGQVVVGITIADLNQEVLVGETFYLFD